MPQREDAIVAGAPIKNSPPGMHPIPGGGTCAGPVPSAVDKIGKPSKPYAASRKAGVNKKQLFTGLIDEPRNAGCLCELSESAKTFRDALAVSRDGHRMQILANVSSALEVAAAIAMLNRAEVE